MSLLKLNRGALSVVVGVIMGHYIMETHARRICLHLLGTCPAICQRRMKYLGTYYMDELEELSRIDIGGLNHFIRSSVWFRD